MSTGSSGKLVAAPKVTAVDTTAGGDCFNGALAVALAEGMKIEEAVGFACQAASLVSHENGSTVVHALS